MNQTQVYGLIEFDNEIWCSKQILGKEFEISINGIEGVMILPALPIESSINIEDIPIRLLPPNQAINWKFENLPLIWGRVKSYPSLSSTINKVLLSFRLSNVSDGSMKIYEGYLKWIDLFTSYITLITGQGTCKGLKVVSPGISGFSLYTSDDELNRINQDVVIPVLCFRMHSGENDLDIEKMKKVCCLASHGIEPKLEYKLVLDSYTALNNNDYRKAIIEASCALEVCLTNRIVEECNRVPSHNLKHLLQKYRTLGERFELCIKLHIHLPTDDYKSKILKPRNKVIHESLYYEEKVALILIREVEKYLNEFSTL